jgi:hypothetical protein
MLSDIPKWSSAMDLSIAKGDLAKAREYNDLIEGASSEFKDDWMDFAQFKGNNPVGAMIRDGAMRLLSGELGVNKFNRALASEEVQGRAIDSMYGPGTLAQTIKASRNRTDPVAAAQSTELLQAIGAPIMTPGAVEDVEVADPYTGQKTVKRRPVQPLAPATQDELNNRHDFVTKGLSVDGADEGFMKSVGGVSGYASNALKLQSIGGSAADDLLQFTRETTSTITDPAERAAAWASTVDMTARVVSKLNPNKDPLATRTITGLLRTTKDALGEQGFSMKEAPVVASIQKALAINDMAISATGLPVDSTRMTTITSAFAKRNARKQLSGTENDIIEGFNRADTLKAGITLGATPGQASGSDVYTKGVGANGQETMVKQPDVGGVDASHTLVKSYMDEALSLAPVLAAANGQDFDVVLKNTMEDKFSERVLQMFGGKTEDKTMTYGKDAKDAVEKMKNAPGVTVTETADGYEVKSKGKVVDRDMARGMARLMATRMLDKGTFDVNNISGEILSIPDIGNQLALETQAAVKRSIEAGKATPEMNAVGDLAKGSMKSSFGQLFAEDLVSKVSGDYKEFIFQGLGVWKKTQALAKDRIEKTDVSDAWKATGSNALRYMLNEVGGTDELRKIIDAKPGAGTKLDGAIEAFVSQVKGKLGDDFFREGNDGALREMASEYVKGNAVALLNRFKDNSEATVGLGGTNPVTLGGLLGPQRVSWDSVRDKYANWKADSDVTGGKVIRQDLPDFGRVLSYHLVRDLSGADEGSFNSGEALYTRMLLNMHQRAAKRVTSAPEQQATAQAQGAPLNVALLQELPLDKVSVADIIQSAQMLDAKNDETIVYKNSEQLLDSVKANLGPYGTQARSEVQGLLKNGDKRPFSEIMKGVTDVQKKYGTQYAKDKAALKLEADKETALMRKQVAAQTMGFGDPGETGN